MRDEAGLAHEECTEADNDACARNKLKLCIRIRLNKYMVLWC
jgi:hypothetical protein